MCLLYGSSGIGKTRAYLLKKFNYSVINLTLRNKK